MRGVDGEKRRRPEEVLKRWRRVVSRREASCREPRSPSFHLLFHTMCIVFWSFVLYSTLLDGWMMPVDELQERADAGSECKKVVGALLLPGRGKPVPRVPAPSAE